MLLVADVHGAAEALGKAAGRGEPLLVLGDLINLIDYRTLDGILSDLCGKPLVAEVVALRRVGDYAGARDRWRRWMAGREEQFRARFAESVTAQYRTICASLAGSGALVTYGNVDWPDLLPELLPEGVRFVDGEVVEVEGYRVGLVGGGAPTPLGVPGEVSEEEMAAKLAALGEVDILCSHAAPNVGPLRRDVVAGRVEAGFRSILEYLLEARPGWHYFGDVHQPQATRWRVGSTICRNVGYFRATGRAVRHR